jgi:hypothetical protein
MTIKVSLGRVPFLFSDFDVKKERSGLSTHKTAKYVFESEKIQYFPAMGNRFFRMIRTSYRAVCGMM